MIPKLKIDSLDYVLKIINRVPDHENGSETLIDVKVKLVLG
ncbi:hypothetical protein ACSAZL_10490 [Methanosarcina sp. T3]